MPDTYELTTRKRQAIEALNRRERGKGPDRLSLDEYERLRWAIEGCQTEGEVERIEGRKR